MSSVRLVTPAATNFETASSEAKLHSRQWCARILDELHMVIEKNTAAPARMNGSAFQLRRHGWDRIRKIGIHGQLHVTRAVDDAKRRIRGRGCDQIGDGLRLALAPKILLTHGIVWPVETPEPVTYVR